MDDAVGRLEARRSAVAMLEYLVGSLADYIDLGHPNEAEKGEALADMARYEAECTVARRVLSEALAVARAETPPAVAAWAAWHMAWCRRIMAEEVPPYETNERISDQAVRVYVARETLAEWEQVLQGTLDYVHINSFYLNDYDAATTAWLEGGCC